MPVLPVDPCITVEQRGALDMFMAAQQFSEQDLASPRTDDRAVIHTSLSIVERNAFCAFAFSLGSNPAALLRGLARAAVRSRGRASDHDAMKSERDAAQHRERLAIEERDKARSQLAAAEDERDDALAELAHMHERTEVE